MTDSGWFPDWLVTMVRIAHALIERITVRKDGISITWKTKGMPRFLRDSIMQQPYKEAA